MVDSTQCENSKFTDHSDRRQVRSTNILICQSGRVIVSDSNGGRSKQFFAAYAKRVPQTTIYVDCVRGNDTTGDGTALKPFATIEPDRSGNIRARFQICCQSQMDRRSGTDITH